MTTDKDRIQTLEHECARQSDEIAMHIERNKMQSEIIRNAIKIIAGLESEVATLRAAREVKHD